LRSSPERAVTWLRAHLKPAPSAETPHLKKLVTELGSEQFKIRDQAMRALEKLGEVAAPALQKALAGSVTLEVKRRLEVLLAKMEGAQLPPDMLRQVRAVEALEGIGTSEARSLLQHVVTAGAPEGRLTREAQAALQRLPLP